LSILIVILASCALNSDNGLIKALSRILLPDLVFSARPTSLNVEVVVRRRVVTLVATKGFHIPNWLVLGTAGISTQVNLTLMGGIAEVFVLLAGAVVVALVISCHEDHRSTFAGGLALPASQVEKRSGGWTGNALVGCEVGNGAGGRTLGQVGILGLVEDGKPVILLVGAAVDPLSRLQVVPEDVVDHFTALGSSSIAHDLHVASHLSDLAVYGLHSRALSIGTLGTFIGVSLAIEVERSLESVDGGLHVLDLGLQFLLLLGCDVEALAGAESKGYIQVSLKVKEGIALIG
jgi:hypothetical protein